MMGATGISGSDGASVVIELSNLSAEARDDGSTGATSTDLFRDARREETPNGGGVWAWTTLISTVLIQFCVGGHGMSFGVFQDYYVREFLTKYSSSQVSWIGSTLSFFVLTTGIFAGHLFDKGYFYHLVISGSLIFSLSLFMLSLAEPEQYYQVFLAQAVGAGIGGGLSYTPSLAVLAHHFPSPDARSRAMAIAATGISIGGLIQPIMLNQVLSQKDAGSVGDVHSAFKRAMRTNAGLVSGLLLISVLLMRANYPRRDMTGISDEAREKEGHARRPMKVTPMLRRFATDWPYVYFVVGMTLYEVVFFFPGFYMQLKAIKQGLDPTFAFYSICILNGVALFGRIIPGLFVRTLGVANMFLCSSLAATVLMFCMLVVRSVPSVGVFAALYGFFSGTSSSLMTPMLALLAESPAEIGARMGTCFLFSGLGSLTGTPITGALLTSKFIWWRPVVFSGVICASAFVMFVVCRILLGTRKGSVWVV